AGTGSTVTVNPQNGARDTVNGDDGDQVKVAGNATTADVSGTGSVELDASNEDVKLTSSNARVTVLDQLSGETIHASNDTIDPGAGSAPPVGNALGDNHTIDLAPNDNKIIRLGGTGNKVFGDGGTDEVAILQSNTSNTVHGNGSVGLNNSNETVTLTDAGATVTMLDQMSGETINGSGDKIVAGAGPLPGQPQA